MVWILWAAACAPSAPAGDDTGTAVQETVDTGDPPTEVATPRDTAPPVDGLTGRLLGPDGLPAPFEEVLCCSARTCLQVHTGEDGAFRFDLPPEGTAVAVKTHPGLDRSPRWAAALAPYVTGAEGHDLGDVHVGGLPAGAALPLDPVPLDVGDGLVLTAGRAVLTAPPGGDLFDIAAVALPSDRWPAYAELTAPVVAVYALHPFGATASTPIAVSLPSDLAAGTAVQVYTVDDIDGRLSEPAAATADGARITTEAGQGIGQLTHLVVTAP